LSSVEASAEEKVERWMQVVNASWLSFLRPSKFPKGY